MHSNSAEYMLTAVVVIVMLICILGVLWAFLHDRSADQKFSWHQLVKNSFHVVVICTDGKEYVIDIHYNCKAQTPVFKLKGQRGLVFYLPLGFTRQAFLDYINNLSGIDDQLLKVIKCIRNESILKGCNFTHEDISAYRDFKRHLLLKALRNR
ncbi:hypothetical protein YUBABA_01640 [Serratia phage vB_SmaM-Yubaba]|nr:hypothetical protein SUREIYA_00730 [Serratia phage vB_SmaM-Sureiya]UQT03370.1 hypothetical protein YUBABA_01640 [Serratia phage vB_SmaM-Yubaba]